MSMIDSAEKAVLAHESDRTAPCFEDIHLAPANYLQWRAPLERFIALLLLIPAAPVMLAMMALVRATSPGPGLYRQLRVGRQGRTFEMYKIRTMRHDAEASSGAVWSQANDPRITPLGRILRSSHLDELPQLINVIKGDMSLIGPRPERPEFTQHLARAIPGYNRRLAVLPGVTGLAQINLPPDSDLDSVRRKLVLDLEYINTASPLLDLRMLACTALRMVGLRGGIAIRLMLLRRVVSLPPQRRASPASSPAFEFFDSHIVSPKSCISGNGQQVTSPRKAK